MSNLIDIRNQIEKLQKQANEIRTKEFGKTVEEIRAKMQAFGITTKDLQPSNTRDKSKRNTRSKQSSKMSVGVVPKGRVTVAAKYRGPNGETWSGRGLTPKWLVAMIAQGQSKESFAINV